jgi:hypothetical protein
VNQDQVDIADEFFNAIIEYLYVAPEKVNRVQQSLDEE